MSASRQHQIDLGAQGRGGEHDAEAYLDYVEDTESEWRAVTAAHAAGRCNGADSEEPCPICWMASRARTNNTEGV